MNRVYSQCRAVWRQKANSVTFYTTLKPVDFLLCAIQALKCTILRFHKSLTATESSGKQMGAAAELLGSAYYQVAQCFSEKYFSKRTDTHSLDRIDAVCCRCHPFAMSHQDRFIVNFVVTAQTVMARHLTGKFSLLLFVRLPLLEVERVSSSVQLLCK